MTYARLSLLITERREPFMTGKHVCSSAIAVSRLLLLANFSGFYLSFTIERTVFSSIQVKHISLMQCASNVQFAMLVVSVSY